MSKSTAGTLGKLLRLNIATGRTDEETDVHRSFRYGDTVVEFCLSERLCREELGEDAVSAGAERAYLCINVASSTPAFMSRRISFPLILRLSMKAPWEPVLKR